MNIPIPDLQFGQTTVNRQNNRLQIPYLAQYISAVYKFLLGVSIIAAAIMITYGGFLYIIKSTGASVTEGKTYIVDACIGLFLIFGAYTILNTVSPATTKLKSLEVLTIDKDPLSDYLEENGTTSLDRPIPTEKELGTPRTETPIVERRNPNYTGSSSPSTQSQSSIAPPSNSQNIDVSGITYDKTLGGPGNIGKYCNGPSSRKITEYDKRQDLLAKAVLGFEKICIQYKKCVYSQASVSSIPSGTIGKGAPATGFAVKALKSRVSLSPEDVWPNNPNCIEAYKEKPSSVDGMAECREPAANLYNERINVKIAEAKAYASDCVAFVMSIYQCANANFATWANGFKSAVTAILTNRTPNQDFVNKPQMVYFGKIGAPIEEIEKIVNTKGGVKFGDVFYVAGGGGQNGMHFYLYTGGRSDVPFTFIEMGGSGPGMVIPGLNGPIGGANTKNISWQEDIQTKITPTMVYGSYCPQSGCIARGKGSQCYPTCGEKNKVLKKASYGSNGVLMIFRPYAE
ncbi:hypothetical protein IT408_00995 [Candidatus Uhrbacteria bacterium]|nr:hypothetical protein [Candidatus Uhrbacteria bacterium]